MSQVSTASPSDGNPANWDLAKVLYAQGVAASEIVSKCNVSLMSLRKRITRGRWTVFKAEVKQLESKPSKAALGNASTVVREALAARLQDHAVSLSSILKPTNLRGIREENEALAPLVQNSRVVFGWSEQTVTNVFNLALLESAEFIPAKQVQVVDVEQVAHVDVVD